MQPTCQIVKINPKLNYKKKTRITEQNTKNVTIWDENELQFAIHKIHFIFDGKNACELLSNDNTNFPTKP